MSLAIGVDVGGTKIAAGVVDEDGSIVVHDRRPTPGTQAERITDVIVELVQQLRADQDVVAVGIGAAGFVDRDRSVVLFAPNLAWRNEPLREAVEARVGLPVVVENDANVVAWAEYRFGAGRGVHDLVALTIGTGIGGGLVLDGQLYRGSFGVGAEVGHICVVPDGRLCGCGNHGCWEQYASGQALVREARGLAGADRAAAATLLSFGDGTPEGIAGAHVTQAAHRGDPIAVHAFQEVARWLGQGLADLAAVLDPGMFVLGGGASEAGDVLLEPTRDAFEAALTGARYRPIAKVRMAAMGNEAGVVGAADLARR